MKPVRNVESKEIRAVRDFIEVRKRLDRFKEMHYEVFQQFADLLEEYNTALEDAEKEVRSREVSCGPFEVCGEITKIDVDKLYDELGQEDFLKVGGIVEVKKVLSIDKKKFETLADSNSIPQEVVDVCFKRTLKYKSPEKAELP